MSWLQKLKTKTKSKGSLLLPGGLHTKVGTSASSIDISALALGEDDSKNKIATTVQLPPGSPVDTNADAIAGIKLTNIQPTLEKNNAKLESLLITKTKPVSGMLVIRVREAKNVAIRSTTASRPPYIVLTYDKNEVVINPCAGSMSAPVYHSQTIFDLTHDSDLGIHMYMRTDDNQPASCSPSDTHLGSALIQALELPSETRISELWLPMKLPSSGHSTALVFVHLEYRSLNKDIKSISIDDFDLLKVIGKGSFGKVMQVRKKNNGQIYAVKILKKAHIVDREEITHTLSERNVLSRLQHPFIVNLKFSFQTPQKLYLVLPFINGGELFGHLSREGRFEEDRARFYAAELTTALECLHSYGIIYRDLKPENILLDYQGHICLCDFGLCKTSMGDGARTNTFCGTPEYLACEVLLGNGYNQSVDWWTLGILLYEMLTGLPPFYDENLNEMYRKILYAPLIFPPYISEASQSILNALINRDPELRLGSKGGANQVKAHVFFSAYTDWSYILEKRVVPPFKPSVENHLDTSNFDNEFTSLVPMDSVANDSTVLSQTVQGQFQGFTYIQPSSLSNNMG